MQQHDTISWFKNIKAIWAWLIAIVKALVEDLIIIIYLKISNNMVNVSLPKTPICFENSTKYPFSQFQLKLVS